MPRILVTGATGFVGWHCLPWLLSDGWEVHGIYVGLSGRANSVGEPAGVVWHQADLMDPASSHPIVKKIAPTHLLHLAWQTAPGTFWNSSQNLDWVEASVGLFRAFQSVGGTRMVIAGTCAEYDWSREICDEFTTPLRPSTVYGLCKHAAHVFAQAFCHVHGISLAWPRLFYLYGPGSHPQRFPGPIIAGLLRGESPPCSHGRQIRDFLHIRDAASALAAVLKSDLVGDINVASGAPIALSEMLLKIADQLGGGDRLGWGQIPSAANEPLVLQASTRRLNEELGWRPSIGLDEGLKETIAWWKEHSA